MGDERLPVLMLAGELPKLEDVLIVLLGSYEVADELAKTPWLQGVDREHPVEEVACPVERQVTVVPVFLGNDGGVLDARVAAPEVDLGAGDHWPADS